MKDWEPGSNQPVLRIAGHGVGAAGAERGGEKRGGGRCCVSVSVICHRDPQSEGGGRGVLPAESFLPTQHSQCGWSCFCTKGHPLPKGRSGRTDRCGDGVASCCLPGTSAFRQRHRCLFDEEKVRKHTSGPHRSKLSHPLSPHYSCASAFGHGFSLTSSSHSAAPTLSAACTALPREQASLLGHRRLFPQITVHATHSTRSRFGFLGGLLHLCLHIYQKSIYKLWRGWQI